MTGPYLVSYIALWILVITLAVAVFALYHHFGQMYLSSREGRGEQGPRNDKPLRETNARDLSGHPVLLPHRGRPSLVVFASTTCPLCEELRPDLLRFAAAHEDVETVVICGGQAETVREWAGDLEAAARVIADPSQRITARYGVGVLPFFVGLDADGVVHAKGIVSEGGLDLALDLTRGGQAVARNGNGSEVRDDRLAEMDRHPSQ